MPSSSASEHLDFRVVSLSKACTIFFHCCLLAMAGVQKLATLRPSWALAASMPWDKKKSFAFVEGVGWPTESCTKSTGDDWTVVTHPPAPAGQLDFFLILVAPQARVISYGTRGRGAFHPAFVHFPSCFVSWRLLAPDGQRIVCLSQAQSCTTPMLLLCINQGINFFVQMHLDGAGVTDCDHWHDDAGERQTRLAQRTHSDSGSFAFSKMSPNERIVSPLFCVDL